MSYLTLSIMLNIKVFCSDFNQFNKDCINEVTQCYTDDNYKLKDCTREYSRYFWSDENRM